mgnify:FL=1|jgi:DNA-nicking Smr family endonuclease
MKHSQRNQTYGYRKISMVKSKRTKRGFNSYKYSVYSGVENDINILDLKGMSLNQTKDLLIKYIKYCVKNKELPVRVITHNIVEKIVLFKRVIENLKDVEWVVLDINNCGSFTIVPSGSFSKNKNNK